MPCVKCRQVTFGCTRDIKLFTLNVLMWLQKHHCKGYLGQVLNVEVSRVLTNVSAVFQSFAMVSWSQCPWINIKEVENRYLFVCCDNKIGCLFFTIFMYCSFDIKLLTVPGNLFQIW